MDGWIKLHRKIIDNDIWKYDPTAWRIFEYFLLTCDYQSGEVKKAHSTISKYLDIEKSTVSRAIFRLEKAKMINRQRNPNYTLYSISNWHKYQQDTQLPTQPRRNQDATKTQRIQEVRKKKEEFIPNKILSFEEQNRIAEAKRSSVAMIKSNISFIRGLMDSPEKEERLQIETNKLKELE